ncbi:MAG TPA: DUF2127 domain-containing protein [Candidatus Acidoferrales bacterium]|jgi:uncharacterized membrane protein|nr:DUF2127 domain-containing protein [Candidatus Acidoferrales bacterium]
MNAKSLLHGTFRTGVAMKCVDGLFEMAGGILLWFVKPAAMGSTLRMLCLREFSRDPHDFIAVHLLHTSEKLAHGDPLFASIFLLSHGLVKVVLAVMLWFGELWTYPLALFVFSAFSVYQVYRYTHTHSIALLVVTAFDLAIVWLTWGEYRVQKSARKAPLL